MEIITLLREIAPIRKMDEAVEIYAEGSTVYADFYTDHQQLLDSELDGECIDIMVNEQWVTYPYCDHESFADDLLHCRYILITE